MKWKDHNYCEEDGRVVGMVRKRETNMTLGADKAPYCGAVEHSIYGIKASYFASDVEAQAWVEEEYLQ